MAYPIACTTCDLTIENDPGAAGNKCPKCGSGALVPEDN